VEDVTVIAHMYTLKVTYYGHIQVHTFNLGDHLKMFTCSNVQNRHQCSHTAHSCSSYLHPLSEKAWI